MSLAQNVEFMRQFSKLSGFSGLGALGRNPAAASPLVEIGQFGTNPGALKMFAYAPEPLPRAPALAGFTVESTALDNGAITSPWP